MKLKGLAKVTDGLDELESTINEKVDELDTNTAHGQAMDEMLMAASDEVLAAKEALEAVKNLCVDDFK